MLLIRLAVAMTSQGHRLEAEWLPLHRALALRCKSQSFISPGSRRLIISKIADIASFPQWVGPRRMNVTSVRLVSENLLESHLSDLHVMRSHSMPLARRYFALTHVLRFHLRGQSMLP